MQSQTYEAQSRGEFAFLLRTLRREDRIASYGRFAPLGRSVVTRDGHYVILRDWTSRPPLNIHPRTR